VFIRSGREAIASTLMLPAHGGPFPAVVSITGSGTRLISPHEPLPRKLVTSEVAVLLLGKQGVGASGGDWRQETFAGRAANVEAALAWLAGHRCRPQPHRNVRAQPGRVYREHRGGAWKNGLRNPGRPIVTTGARAGRFRLHVHAHARREPDAGGGAGRGRSPDLADRCGDDAGPLVRVHYLCGIYRYDPAPDLERIRIPVLALLAERDNMLHEQARQSRSNRVVYAAAYFDTVLRFVHTKGRP
jgi:hypothetical protein